MDKPEKGRVRAVVRSRSHDLFPTQSSWDDNTACKPQRSSDHSHVVQGFQSENSKLNSHYLFLLTLMTLFSSPSVGISTNVNDTNSKQKKVEATVSVCAPLSRPDLSLISLWDAGLKSRVGHILL